MIDLRNNSASVYKQMDANRFFDLDFIEEYEIDDVGWLMSIKPGLRNVTKFIEDRNRMEEIEVFFIKVGVIPDKRGYKRLLKQFYSKILYPCVVFFEYRDKFKITAWKFIDSVVKNEHIILQSFYVTSWIHDPALSEKTKHCIEEVRDVLLNGEGCIRDLYDRICAIILTCDAQYIGSRAHLNRIVYELTGIKNHPIIDQIDSSKRYEVKNPRAKYKKKEYGSSYKLIYDYEDIWHVFMQNEDIRQTIAYRRYRDMEDLVRCIDSKYEEYYS